MTNHSLESSRVIQTVRTQYIDVQSNTIHDSIRLFLYSLYYTMLSGLSVRFPGKIVNLHYYWTFYSNSFCICWESHKIFFVHLQISGLSFFLWRQWSWRSLIFWKSWRVRYIKSNSIHYFPLVAFIYIFLPMRSSSSDKLCHQMLPSAGRHAIVVAYYW